MLDRGCHFELRFLLLFQQKNHSTENKVIGLKLKILTLRQF